MRWLTRCVFYPDVHEDGTVSVVELAEVYGKAGIAASCPID